MDNDYDTIGETGLLFFGKMTASISHEIKNVLAIINENAGIIEDFTFMEKKGIPLDSERILGVAQKVKKQIQRADGIIKKMNGFAHSIDEPVKPVDLSKIIEFVTGLSDRFAANRGVTIEIEPLETSVTITTRPFFLENLIWLCLDFAMDVAGDGKSVKLIAREEENSAIIKFTKLKGLAAHHSDNFPGKQEKTLLEVLKADLVPNQNTGEIVLILPKEIAP